MALGAVSGFGRPGATDMLTLHALPPRPTANDNATAPGPGADAPTDPAGFSSMLRHTQASTAPTTPKAAAPKADGAAHAPPAHRADADPSRAASDEATPAPDAPPADAALDRPRVAIKLATRGLDAEPRDLQPEHRQAESEPIRDNAAPEAKATDAVPTPPVALDPAIANWLAGLQRVPSSEKPAAPEAPAAATPVLRANSAQADAKTEAVDAKDRAAHALETTAPVTAFAAVLAEQHAAEPAPTRHTDTHTEAIGASAFAPAPAAPHGVSAPTPVALPTPVDSPDFAQALGVQMSVLAKDGIQHAELHLNPAEMGPVSVQIVMDGTQARIDFGADVAATRQAIEAGLPELASALRDAGFTLAGGGVSQHSGSRHQASSGDSGDARPATRPVSDEAVMRVSAAAHRVVTRGGLDLYA